MHSGNVVRNDNDIQQNIHISKNISYYNMDLPNYEYYSYIFGY